MSQSQTKAVVP